MMPVQFQDYVADPRSAARVLAAPLRDGRDLERGQAQCRPSAPWPNWCGAAIVAPCHHPEYRQSASGCRRAGRPGDRASWQYALCQMPDLRHAGGDRRHPRPFRDSMAMRPTANSAAASSRPRPSPSARPCRKTRWRGPKQASLNADLFLVAGLLAGRSIRRRLFRCWPSGPGPGWSSSTARKPSKTPMRTCFHREIGPTLTAAVQGLISGLPGLQSSY